MKLREHQIVKSYELASILSNFNIAYLAGEVRSGKTLTALNTANIFNAESVLIITKKKAISSIESDYNNFGFTYDLTCINYESLHKLDKKKFDLVIYDEAHSLGAYPKKSKRTSLCKKLFKKTPCILMSGTPAVESYSQLYHQFWISDYSPFKQYTTFYKWANTFVNKKEMKLPTHTVVDYSGAKVNEINKIIKPYFVKMTQQDAGFETKVKEHYLEVKTPDAIDKLAKQLLNDKAIEGETGFILGDTPAKLQSKVHQIYNGSCIIETASGDTFTKVFSDYKAKYIKDYFKGKKIAIMYFYQAELKILSQVFGSEKLTTDLQTFNDTNVNLAIQQTSTEGINLSKADCLVYFNLGFSGKNYLQSRDRLTIKDRPTNDVYYVCESGGFTKRILKAVKDKKDYNSKLFIKDYG
jgi:SNF2 family DNA or RNA helicase